MPVPKRCLPASPSNIMLWKVGLIVLLKNPRLQSTGCSMWWLDREDWGGTLARGKVIPGKGNIFMLIHPRGHPAFMSAIGNVLRYGVTEATLFQQALRSCRKATRCFSFGAGTQALAALWMQCWWERSWQKSLKEMDALGPEGCDFEVDTESFRVRIRGQTLQVSRKAAKNMLAKWLICQCTRYSEPW